MTIKIDYWITEGDNKRLMSTTLNEDEIFNYLHNKFKDGELPCPIQFNRETASVRFEIDSVTV